MGHVIFLLLRNKQSVWFLYLLMSAGVWDSLARLKNGVPFPNCPCDFSAQQGSEGLALDSFWGLTSPLFVGRAISSLR